MGPLVTLLIGAAAGAGGAWAYMKRKMKDEASQSTTARSTTAQSTPTQSATESEASSDTSDSNASATEA